MIFKRFFILLGMSVLACSQTDWQRHNFSELTPHVVTISPEAGSVLSTSDQFSIQFSQALLPESVNDENIFLVSESDFLEYDDNWLGLVRDVADGDIDIIPMTLTLSDDAKEVRGEVSFLDESSTNHVLLVTPKVLSAEYVPFDQTQAGGDARYFAISYLPFVTLSEQANHPDQIAVEQTADVTTSTDVVASDAATTPEATTGSTVASNPQINTLPTEPSQSAGEISGETPVDETPILDFMMTFVSITEVVTDPQQDHNDSSGGNGVLFDGVAGNGTISATDEYIELYNASPDIVNLQGWSLEMLDGTDATQLLSAESWAEFYFSEQGNFTEFYPGEFLVLGNPDGAINNSLTLNLYNQEGEIMDSVLIEDANADNLSNEAYSLDFTTGFWEQTTASPGWE